MGCQNHREILLGPAVPHRALPCRAGRSTRIVGSCPGPLDTRIHVRLVVIANVQEVMAPLESPGYTEHPYVKGTPIPADSDNLLLASLFL